MVHAAEDPALVPELLVTDTARSIEFWCGLCGFHINYQRAQEGFAYISRGTANVMLDQHGMGRDWITASLERPFGRGVNLRLTVLDLAPIIESLGKADYRLFMAPETKWYRVSDAKEAGVRQFLVADPDGYVIRYQTPIGNRAVTCDGDTP